MNIDLNKKLKQYQRLYHTSEKIKKIKTLIFQLSIKMSEKTPTFGSLNIIGFTKHDGKLQ